MKKEKKDRNKIKGNIRRRGMDIKVKEKTNGYKEKDKEKKYGNK